MMAAKERRERKERKGQTMKQQMIAIMCAMLLFVGTGCSHKTTGNSIITASAGEREVKATIDGPAWMQPSEQAFTLTFTGHKVVIEKERLLLDAKELAKIPAAATKCEVVVSNGTLRVTADGAEVLATTITK